MPGPGLVTERGGQVIYTVGNHDGDLAWDLKAATAVREATGAKLCLAADLVLPGGEKIRVEHGHQIDPYNCFHDPRNPLDTPLGHHIVREVIPKIEWLGRDWLTGAHEMADPADFPSFLASRLVYRKLVRHLWWVILVPIVLFALVLPQVGRVGNRYPDAGRWLHDGEILGYGALVDIAIIALLIAIVSRRAWTSISALALSERGYGQNSAARERADELIGQGYTGYLSGHTHHPELHAHGDGFYGNTGSCTSVVEAINTIYGMPPVYLRTQQLSWLEISAGPAVAGTMTRTRTRIANGCGSSAPATPSSSRRGWSCPARPASSGSWRPRATRTRPPPKSVASWPEGPDWPDERRHLKRRHLKKAARRAVKRATSCEPPRLTPTQRKRFLLLSPSGAGWANMRGSRALAIACTAIHYLLADRRHRQGASRFLLLSRSGGRRPSGRVSQIYYRMSDPRGAAPGTGP